MPIKDTPVTLKAHLGYTNGDSALAGPDGHYLDYSVGADVAWKNLTFNVSYVDTDMGGAAADAFYSVPGGKRGSSIVWRGGGFADSHSDGRFRLVDFGSEEGAAQCA